MACLLASAAVAQQPRKVAVSSGTGFFVSRMGEIITNEHVVGPCASNEAIYFTGPNQEPRQARLVGVDEKKDLALLRTGYRPNRVAKLRWTHANVKEREKVFLIGYPEAQSIRSPYATRTATIKALEGPFGEDQWLQFSDAARHGNSGGPLLDFAGNVVGVVTAKSQVLRLNRLSARQEVIEESDIAVTAAELKRFLDRYRVHYQQNDATLTLTESRLENTARHYVVHIFCATEGSGKVRFK